MVLRPLSWPLQACVNCGCGSTGCDPAYCVVWFRFRMFRGYLAHWLSEGGRVHRVLELVGEGCLGHGPVHLLVASASEIGLRWDLVALGWSLPGLPLLSSLAGPVQHLRLIFATGRVLVVVLFWIFVVPCSYLTLAHVRERDIALLRGVMVGGVWNGRLLGRVGASLCLSGSAVHLTMMVTFFHAAADTGLKGEGGREGRREVSGFGE